MNGAGETVPWMPPLRQPELQNVGKAFEWPVETEVALRMQKRDKSPGRNIGETREPQ